MDEALLLVQTRPLPRQAPLVFVAAARLALLEGDHVAATRLAATHDLPLARARLALDAGHPEEAVALLDGVAAAAGEPVKYGTRLRAALLRAAAMDTLGKREAAEQVLVQAVREAEPAGFLRPFLDHGPLLLPLLQRVAGEFPFARRLVRLLNPTEEAAAEPLSTRESEVLQLVAAGHTNQQIADELVIALATAKKHVSNILGKLHVDNRTEAVARARELGILGD
jgi:LuxR family maltose regulon positive regulatory protein